MPAIKGCTDNERADGAARINRDKDVEI